MAVQVKAEALLKGDVFAYSFGTVEVEKVTPIGPRLVEVHGSYSDGGKKWLDYAEGEEIEVSSGPSLEVKPIEAPKPSKTATQRAREAVRKGALRGEPSSAALVLYALAAAQDEAGEEMMPSEASIATGAGLAISTIKGYLRTLAAKGLVRSSNTWWEVR